MFWVLNSTLFLLGGKCHCHLENFALFLPVLPWRVTTMPRSFGGTEILTIKEVSDYLKVTERTIYRLAATKKIPAFKVGGSWRFSLVDIDRWIKQQSIEGLDGIKDHDIAAK